MKLLTSPLALGLLLAAISRVAWAQSVPVLVNYQGQLTDATGAPLATADYTLTFSIHDAASGGNVVSGPQVFDGRSGAGYGPRIPVVQGNFNVMPGPADTASRSLAEAFNAPTRYVEIKVAGNAPLEPRQQILSAPSALRALETDKLSGHFAGDFVAKAGDARSGPLTLPPDGLSVGGSQLVATGAGVGVGTSDPKSLLHADGGGSDAMLRLQTSGTGKAAAIGLQIGVSSSHRTPWGTRSRIHGRTTPC